MFKKIPGCHYVDVLSKFIGLSSGDVSIRDNDDHLNVKGHKKVAQILAEKIIILATSGAAEKGYCN